jgi:hypothetical protein
VSLKNADVNFAIFFLVLVAIYLILYLIQKGARIIKSRTWDNDKPFLKVLSVFHYYFFVLFHSLLIVGLFYYIPENLRLFIAIIVGFFAVMTIHLQTLSKGNDPDLSLIVPITIVLFEIVLILIFLIPFFAANVNDATFAFYYLWSIPVLQYLIAGVMFGNLFAIIISADSSQKNSKILQLQPISEQKTTQKSLLWGIVILLGLFLTTIAWEFLHP